MFFSITSGSWAIGTFKLKYLIVVNRISKSVVKKVSPNKIFPAKYRHKARQCQTERTVLRVFPLLLYFCPNIQTHTPYYALYLWILSFIRLPMYRMRFHMHIQQTTMKQAWKHLWINFFCLVLPCLVSIFSGKYFVTDDAFSTTSFDTQLTTIKYSNKKMPIAQ